MIVAETKSTLSVGSSTMPLLTIQVKISNELLLVQSHARSIQGVDTVHRYLAATVTQPAAALLALHFILVSGVRCVALFTKDASVCCTTEEDHSSTPENVCEATASSG
eukprot:GFYU01018543.1.p1 GENE.GFYU01018543.1~~GFYU01018543.1.p1  ORF type:complete len:108 (-),score=14.58 GFYU01018543.1:228-551(-)